MSHERIHKMHKISDSLKCFPIDIIFNIFEYILLEIRNMYILPNICNRYEIIVILASKIYKYYVAIFYYGINKFENKSGLNLVLICSIVFRATIKRLHQLSKGME